MIDMNKAFRIIWTMLLLQAAVVFAEDRFQIELVVFGQDMPTTELFTQTRSEIEWPNRVVNVTSLGQIDPEQKSLAQVYDTLSRYSVYQPLGHFAWIQTIAANAAGDAVRIQGTGNVLNGYVRLERGDYLTVTVDLEYQPDPERYFRMNEVRSIKFNEDHYFDHPKFGVIAKVKPL